MITLEIMVLLMRNHVGSSMLLTKERHHSLRWWYLCFVDFKAHGLLVGSLLLLNLDILSSLMLLNSYVIAYQFGVHLRE